MPIVESKAIIEVGLMVFIKLDKVPISKGSKDIRRDTYILVSLSK